MIEINCPHCGFTLRIKPKYAGREGKCAKCNGRLTVPALTPAEPPLQRELPTPKPRHRAEPVESTALADLDDAPPPKPARPAPAPVSTSLDDLDREESDWQDPAEIENLLQEPPAKKRRPVIGILVAVVLGIPFLVFTLYAMVNAIGGGGGSTTVEPASAGTVAAQDAPAPQVALRPPQPLGPAPSRGTQSNTGYAATGLPTYPGLQFAPAQNQQNPMFSTLTGIDPASARTFRAVTPEGYEAVSTAFYQQFEAQGWTITSSGYGNQANKEVFIVAQKQNQTLAYCTVAHTGGTAVFITIAGTPASFASSAPSDAPMVAIPLHEFPHFPGLEFAGTSTLPEYTMPTGGKPNYQAAYEGVVTATFADVSAFYKDALETEGRWASTSFTESDGKFTAKGGRGDFRYVLEGKPVTRGTHLVLAFVQPGTPF